MPLLYGEGNKAAQRLQVHIFENLTDESIFSWEASIEERPELLAPSPDGFQNCAKLVRWSYEDVPIENLYNNHRETRRMTNRGPDLRLPVLIKRRNGYATDATGATAVLKCRYEDNLRISWTEAGFRW